MVRGVSKSRIDRYAVILANVRAALCTSFHTAIAPRSGPDPYQRLLTAIHPFVLVLIAHTRHERLLSPSTVSRLCRLSGIILCFILYDVLSYLPNILLSSPSSICIFSSGITIASYGVTAAPCRSLLDCSRSCLDSVSSIVAFDSRLCLFSCSILSVLCEEFLSE